MPANTETLLYKHKYNTFWRRFAAAIIDSLILWPLTFISGYLDDSHSSVMFCIGSLALSVIYAAYFVILHANYGQTVGKKITNIKVVDIDEVSLIGIKRAIIRELPWVIADIGIFLYLYSMLLLTKHPDLEDIKDRYNNLITASSLTWMLIELITMLTNYKKRAVHDYLAKSVVVKTDG